MDTKQAMKQEPGNQPAVSMVENKVRNPKSCKSTLLCLSHAVRTGHKCQTLKSELTMKSSINESKRDRHESKMDHFELDSLHALSTKQANNPACRSVGHSTSPLFLSCSGFLQTRRFHRNLFCLLLSSESHDWLISWPILPLDLWKIRVFSWKIKMPA